MILLPPQCRNCSPTSLWWIYVVLELRLGVSWTSDQSTNHATSQFFLLFRNTWPLCYIDLVSQFAWDVLSQGVNTLTHDKFLGARETKTACVSLCKEMSEHLLGSRCVWRVRRFSFHLPFTTKLLLTLGPDLSPTFLPFLITHAASYLRKYINF